MCTQFNIKSKAWLQFHPPPVLHVTVKNVLHVDLTRIIRCPDNPDPVQLYSIQ